MLKMASNFVLGRSAPSTYRKEYASGPSLPAAALREGARLGAPGVGGCNDGHFEHPVGEDMDQLR